jgi:shikimate dehydrogenase
MTEQYAVFGNPIAHSRSPEIHQHFARQFSRIIDYKKILATEADFPEQLQAFFSQGGKGCNVTVPFKELCCTLCDQLTSAAERAGAVNTVYLDEHGKLCGHNTDGAGLLRDLTANHQQAIAGKQVVVLGAGGATRGILEPLVGQNPASLTLVNRTEDKARALATRFSDLYPIAVLDRQALKARPVDLLINATSASLSGALPVADEGIITAKTFCYDLAYASEPTAFLQWARANGAADSVDGLGMLVEQAAIAFATWTGQQPDTRELIRSMAQPVSA